MDNFHTPYLKPLFTLKELLPATLTCAILSSYELFKSGNFPPYSIGHQCLRHVFPVNSVRYVFYVDERYKRSFFLLLHLLIDKFYKKTDLNDFYLF